MKALVVRILDAGVFKDPRRSRSQDKMVDINGKTSRYDKRSRLSTPYLQVSSGALSYKHVANLLRVLFGQRPVPTIRNVHESFTGDPYYEKLAKKTRIKIETPIISREKYPSTYPEEILTTTKSIKDSWQTSTRPYYLDNNYVQIKGGLLYPDRLKRFLGDELYNKFKKLVSKFGSYRTITEAIELLNKNKNNSEVIAFCNECKKEKKTSLANMILNTNVVSITIHAATVGTSNLNTLMVLGSPEIIEKFRAILYVPVEDSDIEKIKQATGIATFLEGGYAFVDGIEDWSELLEIDTVETVEGKYVSD